MCNPFQNLNIPHCTIVTGDICRECEIGFSVSNDGKSCVNIPNCLSVNEEGECDQCERYYIFDDEGNCVHDYCQLYNEDYKEKVCYYCFMGFYNDNGNCTKIPIPYCLSGDEKSCTSCVPGTNSVRGECIVAEKFIDGCVTYNDDRTCSKCNDNYKLENGACTLEDCQGHQIIEQCSLCEDGYYYSPISFQCYSYDGRTASSDGNKGGDGESGKAVTIDIKITLPLLLLLLII